MRKSLLSLAVLGALSVPALSFAEDAADAHSHPAEKGTAPATAPAAEPTSPHTVTYNAGLFSQYVFRGLTQTGEEMALQGGIDYSHTNGFYAGTWASNVSWLEDSKTYDHSSLEIDIYGGYRNSLGDTGIAYDVGLLQYIYPGDRVPTASIKRADTTEVYGSLSYKWLASKVSYVISEGAWGVSDGRGTWYAEVNANIPLGKTGLTASLHAGRQDFDGGSATSLSAAAIGCKNNNCLDYTDYKIGLTKSWSNSVNLGTYFTHVIGDHAKWTDLSGQDLAHDELVLFVQKTF